MENNKISKFASENESLIMELAEQDNNLGLCVNCGEESFGVESDACNYNCDSCDEKLVFGAPELLFYI